MGMDENVFLQGKENNILNLNKNFSNIYSRGWGDYYSALLRV